MALWELFMFAVLLCSCWAQLGVPVPSFFNVPATAFNRGGMVNFGAGKSLGDVCRELLMAGGKEALSDGMGTAAKYYANQRISSQVAGGTDPQMQCLFQQATGSMMPGVTGPKDPGNLFGDYFDTVIEYPMILDPCSAPQCNGKVNPTMLLMQAYAPLMRMGGAGAGYGGMSGGMNNPFGAMGANPLMSALLPQQPTGSVQLPAGNVTALNASAGVAAGAAAPGVPRTAGTQQPANPLANMIQNPQMMQMFQQFLMQNYLRNPSQAGLNTGATGFSPLAGFPLASSMFL